MAGGRIAGGGDRLTVGLTAEQRNAVTTRASPLCIVAGAGAGKTRVLTHRIAWHVRHGEIDANRVLAVTFTRRAARQMRSRLRRLGLRDAVRAGTFHSAALAQLRRYDADLRREPRPVIGSGAGLLSELLSRGGRAARHDDVRRVVNEINWAQARMVSPGDYPARAEAARRRPPLGSAARFASVFSRYQTAKLKRRVLDFNDVLNRCRLLMRDQPAHARAQRWLNQHLFVDEFQDVNPLQFELLKSWLGDDSTLVVVGDPDQAIYGWNGADPDLIRDVGDHFPGCAVVSLRTNFRSAPEILAAAARVLDRPAQIAVKPSETEPAVTVCHGDDEAATLARAVRNSQLPGAPWRTQAVLARTNRQLAPLRKALLSHGIPVVTRTDGDLLQFPEIKRLTREWPRGAGLAAAVIDTRVAMSEHTSKSRGPQTPPRALRTDQAQARIEAFLGFADDHLALDPDATVGSFLTEIRFGETSAGGRAGVHLMTFHAAKGLQWQIVHIVGLEDGLVPIRTPSAAQRAEERRLLGVAITRAARQLHVMWCDQRVVGDRLVMRRPSPWLSAIAAPAPGPRDAEAEAAAVREAIARARRALEASGGPAVGESQQTLPL